MVAIFRACPVPCNQVCMARNRICHISRFLQTKLEQKKDGGYEGEYVEDKVCSHLNAI